MEEDDLFKIHSDNLKEDAFLSLHLVAPSDCNFEAEGMTQGPDGADISNQDLQEVIRNLVNEQGLLVLATSQLNIEYLVQNNQRVIQTMLRSKLLQEISQLRAQNKQNSSKRSFNSEIKISNLKIEKDS